MITDSEIKMRGMDALATELGEVAAEKFIALVHRDEFNYTKWRTDNLKTNGDLKELSKQAMQYNS